MKTTKTYHIETHGVDVYTTYAAFLIQCRKVMGPFDVEKLAHDDAYKAEFFNRVSLSADDTLFELASLVSNQLNEDSQTAH